MTTRPRGVVLLVEDDRNTAVMVGEWLEREGFEVDFAEDGIDAVNLAAGNSYDAIVLDLTLPRLNGMEACRRIRCVGLNTTTPVLMVTAHDSLEDKLDGLQAGADDYLTKPFYPSELEARIVALIRRQRLEVAPALLKIGEVVLDPRSQRVSRNGREIELTPTGYRILHILMREAPRVVTRAQLQHELWGQSTPDSDALRSHLYTLRRAIDRGQAVQILHTLPSVGYRAMPALAYDVEQSRRQRKRMRSGRSASCAEQVETERSSASIN